MNKAHDNKYIPHTHTKKKQTKPRKHRQQSKQTRQGTHMIQQYTDT